MRKSKQDAAATRIRIVEAASAQFRRNGIDRTGLSDLMGAAGLTHGGFYKHFTSKNQVVVEACASAVEGTIDVISGRLAVAGLSGAVDGYLSTKQRDATVPVCPFAAFGSELARADTAAKRVATDGFRRLVDIIAAELGSDAEDARGEAIQALSAMFGALMMSRIAAGTDLSTEILDTTRRRLVAARSHA